MQAIVTIWCSVATKDWILLLQGFSQAEYRQLSALASSAGAENRVLLAPECEAPPHAVARLLLALGTTPSIAPVAQALAWGVPALVADNSPWSRLEPKQAGWCVQWNEYTVALDRVLRLEDAVLSEYGRCARQLAQQEFAWPEIAGRLLTFYRNLRS
jgi:glycosyltransferase involved in cell wall biosynthesis